MRSKIVFVFIFALAAASSALTGAARAQELPAAAPSATVDLSTADGVRAVAGSWKYSDARIVDADFPAAGPDGQPTGAPARTYDYAPKAGGRDFDDSGWETVAPEDLARRRGRGRLSFGWYRFSFTVPETVGGMPTSGATIVFEATLDDYAEVWVDGELTRFAGQRGGSVVAGWNAPNRLVAVRGARPGQTVKIAVFAINGPISASPTNFVYIREARLEFYGGEAPGPYALKPAPAEVSVDVVRRDRAGSDRVLGENPKLYKLADGFRFTEGPVWTPDGLLFSDPNANTIYRYSNDGALSVFRTPSGYSGADIAAYGQPGSNGLAVDPATGALVVNQHGNRRVVRIEKDGTDTVLADRFEGKRLNSPNDLVFRSDGTLFFTDPPFGLPKFGADPRKELPFSGVYALRAGKLTLLTKEFSGPNGIALSPDEKTLYVGNWDERRKTVFRYDLAPDGTVSNGRLLYDFTALPGEDAIDGIKVDAAGDLYVSGPGGLHVLDPDGRLLATIVTPRHVHNMAWGDADGRSLYLCARSGLYKLRTLVPGARTGK